jgi:predicted nucleic acid-binding protein
MKSVVCNAGPLIALTGIGQAGLLRELFGEVLVSGKVRDEVEAGGKTGAGASLLTDAPWIRVIVLTDPPDPLLETLLDQGEAETISLALQSSAALVLMDERKGRKIARGIYGLSVIGTGRLLTEAKKAGFISAVRPLIDQMRLNGYWLSDKIVEEILRQAGE